MTILIEINNEQPIPLMWYIFILLFFFRILALENIAKILTTGPRLVSWGLLRWTSELFQCQVLLYLDCDTMVLIDEMTMFG